MVDEFNRGEHDSMLALEVPTRAFGVPFGEDKQLIDVLKKPANPPNNFAVTGIYLYGPKVFLKRLIILPEATRGEYEISSIHSTC